MGFLSDIIGKVSSVFGWLDDHKVAETVARSTSLLSIAIPIAKTIATLTPGKVDDDIVAAVEKWGVPISTLTQQGLTGAQKVLQDGAKQKAVAELLRNKLAEIISKGGKVNWGSEVLTTTGQVFELDQSALESAALLAYRTAVEHDPTVKQAPQLIQPAQPVAPAEGSVADIEADLKRQRKRLAEFPADGDPAQRQLIENRIKKNEPRLEEARRREGKV